MHSVAVGVVGFSAVAAADTLSVDFESYSLGTIDNQDGWSSSGPYDHEVDGTTVKPAGFGAQSLRISNAVVSGQFDDQTFSKSLRTRLASRRPRTAASRRRPAVVLRVAVPVHLDNRRPPGGRVSDGQP